jgi:hypothetical protein
MLSGKIRKNSLMISKLFLKTFIKSKERKALIKSAQLSEDVLDIPTFHRLGKNFESE